MALLVKPLLQPSLDLHRSPLKRVVGIMRYRLGFTLQAQQRGGRLGTPCNSRDCEARFGVSYALSKRMFVKIRVFFGVRHRELLRNYLIVDSPIFYRKMSAESLGRCFIWQEYSEIMSAFRREDTYGMNWVDQIGGSGAKRKRATFCYMETNHLGPIAHTSKGWLRWLPFFQSVACYTSVSLKGMS